MHKIPMKNDCDYNKSLGQYLHEKIICISIALIINFTLLALLMNYGELKPHLSINRAALNTVSDQELLKLIMFQWMNGWTVEQNLNLK
ncbi:MAG: hypothetical protein HRT89_18180 [Lentisphaeria bacterium]|nr:hypothetical protein [Lentisphaeria bacterium]NQZ69986.1 hypothetical protein [Lentisphaeria bacterium]